jgi:hypothetical protein
MRTAAMNNKQLARAFKNNSPHPSIPVKTALLTTTQLMLHPAAWMISEDEQGAPAALS